MGNIQVHLEVSVFFHSQVGGRHRGINEQTDRHTTAANAASSGGLHYKNDTQLA